MINPQHQNININISYNLGADKMAKPLPAKKINKALKTHTNPSTQPCDIEIKLNRKNGENNIKKSNQHKSVHQPRRSKKKKEAPLRNTLTPDIFADRRIKTQGPSTEHDLLFSAFKKDKTSSKHNKSIQVPLGKSSQSTKKPNSQFKAAKNKHGHVTSCTMPNWKKPLLQFGQHTISQAPATKKKRTQSHSTFIRNDKVISKLLNMSMLASQLGSSQPITSERRSNSSNLHSRTLKEFMSSMDMRLIQNMKEDCPIFADKRDSSHPDIIRGILRRKDISLQQLTYRVVLIQRKCRQKLKKGVIGHYNKIFKQIAAKLKKQEVVNEISGIELSPEQDRNASDLFQNQGLVSSIKKQTYELKDDSLSQNSFDNMPNNLRWIQQNNETTSFNQTRQMGLNIKKYRELVDNELQRKKNPSKQIVKQKYKEQQQQWNNINKQITNIMNYKGSIDSQLLLDELIKQSKNNQDWIDNQSEGDERRDRQWEREVFQPQNKISFSQYSKQAGFSDTFSQQQDRQIKKGVQDSLEEEQDNYYDKTKYQEIKELQMQSITPNEPFEFKQQNLPMPMDIDNSEPLSEDKPIDQVWISQQLMENNVVRNYLDCGLGDFGININEKIIQLPSDFREDLEDNSHNSEDQAIGAKFQQANMVIFNKAVEVADVEPECHRVVDQNCSIDEVVEIIVRFLISQFATDISFILKKSTGPQVPIQQRPIPRIQGISTNYSAIVDYLTKFIAFIMKSEPSIQKIVEIVNRDIGPTSLQILSYLRPQSEEGFMPGMMDVEEQEVDDDQGLFVVPADIYEEFQLQLDVDYRRQNKKEMNPRMKAYLSFWHRCIFESYNQCLDYQRPYGIEGRPYEWTTESKVFREVKNQHLALRLHKAENRLLELTSLVGGIIFQKQDSPFVGAELNQQQRHMMNEERLSRILATELLQSQQSWINYNDQMAQLLVELARMIEERLFFQHGTQLKKIQRRRKIVIEESIIEEVMAFNIDEL